MKLGQGSVRNPAPGRPVACANAAPKVRRIIQDPKFAIAAYQHRVLLA